jgi:hypothetical protein
MKSVISSNKEARFINAGTDSMSRNLAAEITQDLKRTLFNALTGHTMVLDPEEIEQRARSMLTSVVRAQNNGLLNEEEARLLVRLLLKELLNAKVSQLGSRLNKLPLRKSIEEENQSMLRSILQTVW